MVGQLSFTPIGSARMRNRQAPVRVLSDDRSVPDQNGVRAPISFDPDRPDFAPYGLTCVHWRPSPMQRCDHHNEIELNFLQSGSVTYLFGGRKTVVEAGRLTVFWAAMPHQIIEYGDSSGYFVATIPLPWFLQWRLPDHFVKHLLNGNLAQESTTRLAKSDSELFVRWKDDLLNGSSDVHKAVLLEMQARLLRLALNLPAATTPDRRRRLTTVTDVALTKVERMACFVAQRYTDPLTVQEIATLVKLHPNYAMNLFHKTFGTTLIQYLTGHRISHARRLLATTDMTVTDVAFNSGFNSISRFNEAFRRSCGCSPREYRKTHLLSQVPDDSA